LRQTGVRPGEGAAAIRAESGDDEGHANRRAAGLFTWARLHRSAVSLVSTVVVTVIAYGLAYAIRFEMEWPHGYTRTFLLTLPLLIVLRIATVRMFRLTRDSWRYSGLRFLLDMSLAVTLSSLAFVVIAKRLPLEPAVPRSVILFELVLASYLLAGIRVAYRMTCEWSHRRVERSRSAGSCRRTLIVGAGDAGSTIGHRLARRPELGFYVVGYVDDDPCKQRTRIWGLPVLGTIADVPRVVRAERVEDLLVAMPAAPSKVLRRIVDVCREVPVNLKVLPASALGEVDATTAVQIRDLRVEDLLAREPVQLELPELSADLGGQSVLITGAAGSIGSELARQVALHRPRTLVLFDQAETDLFWIDRELSERHPDLTVVPVIGDLLNEKRLVQVLARWKPTRVFHAAAYKHVTMMQKNASEAVLNNLIGTWNAALGAGRIGAEKFIFISTDKAVNPTSVMGMTKRAAELAILSCAELYPRTMYAAVRFGNVLGSQGSVIPIFQRQWAEGKSLTVTHPAVTRYFMTIPEAVQLVLQTSLLPEARGQIAMLDMGEPVRILDLARTFLRLHGVANPDSRIRIIGLRPGEKLHEELAGGNEETRGTTHPKVRLVVRDSSNWRLELYARLHRGPLADVFRRIDAQLSEMWELPRPAAAGSDLGVAGHLGIRAGTSVGGASLHKPDT